MQKGRFHISIGGLRIEGEERGNLSNGFAMSVMKKTRRVSFLVLKLISAFRGFEIGLETRRLCVVVTR